MSGGFCIVSETLVLLAIPTTSIARVSFSDICWVESYTLWLCCSCKIKL